MYKKCKKGDRKKRRRNALKIIEAFGDKNKIIGAVLHETQNQKTKISVYRSIFEFSYAWRVDLDLGLPWEML